MGRRRELHANINPSNLGDVIGEYAQADAATQVRNAVAAAQRPPSGVVRVACRRAAMHLTRLATKSWRVVKSGYVAVARRRQDQS